MNKILKNIAVLLGTAGASASLDSKANAQYTRYAQPQQSVQRAEEYDCNSALASDYKNREVQWQVEIDMEKYPREAKNLEQRARQGEERMSNRGRDQVSTVGEAQPAYEELRLSNRFDLNDFVGAFGKAKWRCLSPNDRARIQRDFANWDIRDRSITCSLYYNPYGFFKKYFSAEGKQKFPEFNNAYKHIVEDAELSQQLTPFNELFYANPALAAEVNKAYPWIKLDRADIPLSAPDRLLVLWIGDHIERKTGNAVFNWNKIREYSNRYTQPQQMPQIPQSLDFDRLKNVFPSTKPGSEIIEPTLPPAPVPLTPPVPFEGTKKEF